MNILETSSWRVRILCRSGLTTRRAGQDHRVRLHKLFYPDTAKRGRCVSCGTCVARTVQNLIWLKGKEHGEPDTKLYIYVLAYLETRRDKITSSLSALRANAGDTSTCGRCNKQKPVNYVSPYLDRDAMHTRRATFNLERPYTTVIHG